MTTLPELRKAQQIGSRAKKAVAVYPDGGGGAVYVYYTNGHFHNVHVGPKAGGTASAGSAPQGTGNEAHMYDHSNASVAGMNLNQIGRALGTFQGRLNEAVAGKRDSREAHRDELMHAEKMGQYASLKAHHANFGVEAPEGAMGAKHQSEHISPIVDGITSMLHNIRMANAKMPIKNRAEIASHFYDHVTKSLTNVARKITGNPSIRFDYQLGALVHGHGNGISADDMAKLQGSGYFKDAHDTIQNMAEQLKNPVPDNFREMIRQGRPQFQGGSQTMRLDRPAQEPQSESEAQPEPPVAPEIATDIQKMDWFHPNINTAKAQFMNPIGNLMGKIGALAKNNLLKEGYGDQQADALSHRLLVDMTKKMNDSIGKNIGPHAKIAVTPEGRPILDIMHSMNTHEALADMNDFRKNAATKLANYYAQLKGGK